MGLLTWIKGTPEDKTTRWLRGQIKDAVDGVTLANACAALAGAGTMAFGMVLPAELANRDALRDQAFDAMRKLLVTLPDSQCDAVFDIITGASLLIDVEPRRDRLLASRDRDGSERAASIREKLGECTLPLLLGAAIALRNRYRMVLGTELPFHARDALLAVAIARLEEWIPDFTDDEAEHAYAEIQRGRLGIDVADRAAALATRRRSERDTAIANASGNEPRNAELERAIVEHPEDTEAYSVLADWLQHQGHPRGELIAAQLRAEADSELAPIATELLATHRTALLGPLAVFEQTRDYEAQDAFVWRRGFIHHARLSYDLNVEGKPRTPLAEVLAMLLAHPSGRLLAELDIGINAEHGTTLEDLIAVLATYRPAQLRRLLLGDFVQEQCEISWYMIGDVAALWRALPDLRHLTIHGSAFELGALEHASLERLEVQTGGLPAATASALALAKLPKLRHFEIWYGQPGYDGDATIADVMPLLERTDLPDLRHLGLMNAAFTDDICRRLAGTPLVAQLTELDLSMGVMSDEGARALKRSAFPKLERLDVSRNYLGDDAIAYLENEFPTVISDDQQSGDEEDRYPSVGE